MIVIWLSTLLSCAGSLIPSIATPFRIEAVSIIALEDGPFVIAIDLRYLGRKPIKILDYPPVIEGPKLWTDRFLLGAGITTGNGEPETRAISLSPGERLVRFVSVGDTYSATPSGVAKVAVKWHVQSPGRYSEPPETLARLERLITLRVEKATRTAIADLSKRLEDCLDGGDTGSTSLVWSCLKNTPIADFLPVAIKLADVSSGEAERDLTLSYVYSLQLPECKRTAALMRYLSKPQPRAFSSLFKFWREHPTLRPPSSKVVESLRNASDIWVRALAAATFGDEFGRLEFEKLNTDVSKWVGGTPTSEFLALLDELESPRYRTRELAAKKVLGLGEAAEAMIYRTLAQNGSAELNARLSNILKQLEERVPSPRSVAAVRALSDVDSPLAHNLLKAIAKGHPGLRSTREAKISLENSRRRQSPKPGGED
jgi:hypothetical protein